MCNKTESIRERIRLYVVNQSRNERLLSEVPHRTFLDLAVVYRLLAIDGKSEDAETISHQRLVELGMNEEELYQAAMKNMQSDVGIFTFGNLFNGILAISLVDSIACISNRETYKGSGVMLNKKVMSAFAEQFESDVLILPSSVHELMVAKYIGDYEQIEYLKQLVHEANSDPTLISEADYLSDNVYLFSRQTQKITIA